MEKKSFLLYCLLALLTLSLPGCKFHDADNKMRSLRINPQPEGFFETVPGLPNGGTYIMVTYEHLQGSIELTSAYENTADPLPSKPNAAS